MNNLPDAKDRNSDELYLLELMSKINKSKRATAKLIGVNESTLRGYLNTNHNSVCPYPVQYCLEVLANKET